MTFTEYYEQALRHKGCHVDSAQRVAVERLQHCHEDWVRYQAHCSKRLRRLFRLPNTPKGVYLWGGVGRGKSFLMDSFYACVPMPCKIRWHFHSFMRDVHQQLKALAGKTNPLNKLAQRIAKCYRLICFDEFHLSDIADAMLLYRLLDGLFNEGVQFIITSNDRPDQLYRDGLHRDRVLPAIALICQKLDILHVDNGIDYRRQLGAPLQLHTGRFYHTPLNAQAHRALNAAFENLASAPDENPLLSIEQREISALRHANGVIWFDFMTLCGTSRSQNDYLELASRFHTLILSAVPQLTSPLARAARRFTWLIDVLYDHKIRLLISAAVPVAELYTKALISNESARTVSRLLEMQSKDYFGMPRYRQSIG